MKLASILTISRSGNAILNGVVALLLSVCSTSAFTAPVILNPLYDSNGNTVNIGKTYFVYTASNRLQEVRQGSLNGKIVESYVIDPVTGQRVKKILNAKSVGNGGGNGKGKGNGKPNNHGGGGNPRIIYYPFQDFLTVVGSNEAGNYSYYFAGGNRIAKKDQIGDYSFIHADHLGDTHAQTDESGNLVERTTHHPYGDIRSGGEEERYSFTGKEQDTTGAFNFHSRAYDPFVRSFLQPDTVVPFRVDQVRIANVPSEAYRFSDSFGVNSYLYVNGNPVANTDPDGNFVMPLVAETNIVNPSYSPQSNTTHADYTNASPNSRVEIYVFEQGGGLQGTFGHVSVRIDNEAYSFSKNGLVTIEPAQQHLLRNLKSREGTGISLDLNDHQAQELKNHINEFQDKRYDALRCNCTDPVETFLETEGYNLGINVFPSGLKTQLEQLDSKSIIVDYTK